MRQYYQTTLIDEYSEISGTFIVLPSKYIRQNILEKDTDKVIKLLGFTKSHSISPGWLIKAVAIASTGNVENLDVWPTTDKESLKFHKIENKYYRFAEYATMANIIPVEHSPLSGDSIGNLIVSASGVGIGGYVGFVIAAGSPWILISVPAGMIFFGAAAGVARGLEEGLREVIKNFIIGKND